MMKNSLFLAFTALLAASAPRDGLAQVAAPEKPVMAYSVRLEKDSAPVEVPKRFKDQLAADIARGSYRPIGVKETRFDKDSFREKVVAEDGAVLVNPDRLDVWLSIQTMAAMDGSTYAGVKSVTLVTRTSQGVMGGHELERKIIPTGGLVRCAPGQDASQCVAAVLDVVRSEIERHIGLMTRTTFLWARSEEIFRFKESLELAAFKDRSKDFQEQMAQMKEFSALLTVEQAEYHR